MDTRTGEVAMKDEDEFRRIAEGVPYMIPIDPANLSAKARHFLAERGTVTITRNSRCPCGSGKRFKRCHMGKE